MSGRSAGHAALLCGMTRDEWKYRWFALLPWKFWAVLSFARSSRFISSICSSRIKIAVVLARLTDRCRAILSPSRIYGYLPSFTYNDKEPSSHHSKFISYCVTSCVLWPGGWPQLPVLVSSSDAARFFLSSVSLPYASSKWKYSQ